MTAYNNHAYPDRLFDIAFMIRIQGESEKSITFWVISDENLVLYFGEVICGKCL